MGLGRLHLVPADCRGTHRGEGQGEGKACIPSGMFSLHATSDFWKLEFISCAMRRMQQSMCFLFRNLNVSPE